MSIWVMRYKQDPKEKLYLVRGKDSERPAWHYVMVEKSLLGLFLKRTNGGSLAVVDFGTVLKSGWRETPPESTREEMRTNAHALYKELQGNTPLHKECENDDNQYVVPSYTPGWPERGTVTAKCLAKNTTVSGSSPDCLIRGQVH